MYWIITLFLILIIAGLVMMLPSPWKELIELISDILGD